MVLSQCLTGRATPVFANWSLNSTLHVGRERQQHWVLGKNMRKFLLGSALAVATLTGSPVLAADVDFAPIPDWSGIYGGVFGAAISVDGHYDGVCSCVQVYDNLEHSGIGYGAGLLL